MMYVHQDSGLINVAYFKFNVNDTSGELDANRPVPFRLTPNILEFLTSTGKNYSLIVLMSVIILSKIYSESYFTFSFSQGFLDH